MPVEVTNCSWQTYSAGIERSPEDKLPKENTYAKLPVVIYDQKKRISFLFSAAGLVAVSRQKIFTLTRPASPRSFACETFSHCLSRGVFAHRTNQIAC